MKRAAFTLVELVFVLLIVGIMGAVATTLYRPDKLLNDARFVKLRLEKTRYLATGYDARNFDGSTIAGGPGCIELTREGLEGNLSKAGAYRLQPGTVVTVSGLSGNTLCFDVAGRPHDGDLTMGTLLHRAVDISVGNGSGSYRIRLYPLSGYGTIISE